MYADTKESKPFFIKCINLCTKIEEQLGRDLNLVGGYGSSFIKEKMETPGLMKQSLIYFEITVVHLSSFTYDHMQSV